MRIVWLFLFLVLIGCGGGDDSEINCSKEIQDIINTHGEADEVDTYESDGYYSATYWYWCKGFSTTFTWGKA